MEKIKLCLALFIIQLIYGGFYLLSKLAFDVGMNTFVFVFYRQAIATLFLTPFAFFSQRKTAPRLSFSIFIKIFMLALFGITMSTNMTNVALRHTTASLVAAISNTQPVFTFFVAVLLRMEKVKIKTKSGIMKIGGVCLCIGGVATIAFYKGPLLKLLQHHHLINTNHLNHHQLPSTNSWIMGVFLMLLSSILWALFVVLQGIVLESYPSKLLLTFLQSFWSTIQTFIVGVAFARDFDYWKLGWNLRLLTVTYSGIIVTGVAFYMQAWVIEKKDPVFLAMNTPLIMVTTTILSALILGEIISLGSVLGAILLVGGLYFVLWGKIKEEQMTKVANEDVEKACEDQSKGSNVNNVDN